MPNPNRINPNHILRGFDGELYTDDGVFFAEVPRFQVQINFQNTDYPPAGDPLVLAVFTGYTVTLTLEATVIRDDPWFEGDTDMLAQAKEGNSVEYTLVGRLNGRTEEQGIGKYTFRSCVPDGAQDLINIQPGQIVNRALQFRCNQPPELDELLKNPVA